MYEYSFFVFVLTSLWNIWGHITTVPACSSGTLTNVLPHRNAMPQTQDTTPHPVTVYRHGANLSLCYPSMWNVTLEYTATHFNVLGETRPGNPSPTFHTHQRTFNLMLSWWSTVGSSVESTVPTGSWTRDLWCTNPVRYPLAHSDFHMNIVQSCSFVFQTYFSQFFYNISEITSLFCEPLNSNRVILGHSQKAISRYKACMDLFDAISHQCLYCSLIK